MARALLVALACAACAAAARYGDYAGARMPQYGGSDYDARDLPAHAHAHEPDDYRGHSPDAPAALDYKYEEDVGSHIGKTELPPVKEIEETDSWQQRSVRKHKKSRAVDTDLADNFDPEDDFPKPRSSNRFIKHHTRLKSRKFENPDDDSLKYSENHRGRIDDSDIEEELHLSSDLRNDKSKRFEDDRYTRRMSTERVVRRKPRDRQMRRKELESAEMPKSESEGERWPLEGVQGRAPPPGPLEERLGLRRRPPEEPVASREFVVDDDEGSLGSPQDLQPREKSKSYNEYGNDYYDMKRVMNIKKKLPTLMRRPTVSEGTQSSSPSTQALEEYMLNRRIFLPPQPATRTTTEPPPTTTDTETTTTVTTTTSPPTTTANATSELSLAEKSRLSILKKARRKESLYLDASTKKPPVLLQVTDKLPTVVMVEPPTSHRPWMRAQEVFGDSPERLAKVKRLMRHKLVANAKNIHELTDNWDDLVCDYVDMSLLDAPSASRVPRDNFFFLGTILFHMVFVIR